jgi:hypothetical protein
MLATEVPYWSEIERMTVRRAPLPAYAPHSDAALIYQRLWEEVCARAQLTPPLAARPHTPRIVAAARHASP